MAHHDYVKLIRREPEPAHNWPPDNAGNASAFRAILAEREAAGGTLSAAEASEPRKPGYKHVRSAGAGEQPAPAPAHQRKEL
ncbi:MAG: hypothetical protein WEE66_13630 [Actinomycetota bacterium]